MGLTNLPYKALVYNVEKYFTDVNTDYFYKLNKQKPQL